MTSYPVVHEARSIPYLANQGTITFHAWTSTIHHPWNPDWLVIDLDPFEGDVGAVRDVAAATKEVLDAYDLASIPVATGSKGFHIWVRLEPTLEYGAVSRAANAIGAFVQLAVPHAATREFLKKEREGKVFVDWLRNSPGATVAVPFTLRPRPNASVAMPFDWSELHDVRPDQWTLTDAIESIGRSPAFPEASTLPIEALEAAAVELGVDPGYLVRPIRQGAVAQPAQASPDSGIRSSPSTKVARTEPLRIVTACAVVGSWSRTVMSAGLPMPRGSGSRIEYAAPCVKAWRICDPVSVSCGAMSPRSCAAAMPHKGCGGSTGQSDPPARRPA